VAHILLVDDNDQVRTSLRLMLQRAGYDVEEAADGEEAVRRYQARPADVVITDIVMPKKDGLEAIMEIWRDFPHARIIALSGSESVGDPATNLEYAQIFGALRSFTKPIHREELLDAVRELLEDAAPAAPSPDAPSPTQGEAP